MIRLLTLVAFVFSPLVAFAADLKPGDLVFLKPDAVAIQGEAPIEINEIPVPVSITGMEAERVQLGEINVSANDVLNADDAISYFTDRIHREPGNARAFFIRGSALAIRAASGITVVNALFPSSSPSVDLDQARNDFNEAIRLDPTFHEVYAARGSILLRSGELDAAATDMTEAVRLSIESPANVKAAIYVARATIWEASEDYEKALEDSMEAIKIDPKFVPGLANVARLKATCPVDRLRDGQQAVELAKQACELIGANSETDRWFYLDTLAAAYAEVGDFAQAIESEQLAVQAIQSVENPTLSSGIAIWLCNDHLNLYRNNKPCRGAFQAVSGTAQETPTDRAKELAKLSEDSWREEFKVYDESIKLNPANPVGYFHRGSAWAQRVGIQPFSRGVAFTNADTPTFYENAINDLNEAIRLDPLLADAFEVRGRVSVEAGKIDSAIEDLSKAIAIDSTHASAYFSRGDCWRRQGDFGRALDDWTEGLKHVEETEHKKAFFERMAWLRATCPDERFRSGRDAVDFAVKATQSDGWLGLLFASTEILIESRWGEWEVHGTVAAAYAEAGDFGNAIKWQRKALASAGHFMDSETKHDDVPPGYQERLALYQSDTPYRDSSSR